MDFYRIDEEYNRYLQRYEKENENINAEETMPFRIFQNI